MQTITTYYLSPTNCRGARYKAITSGKSSIVVDIDYRRNSEENHILAFKALVNKMKWNHIKTWSIGHLHDGSSIFVNAQNSITID